jgi:ankyrin repeat protein
VSYKTPAAEYEATSRDRQKTGNILRRRRSSIPEWAIKGLGISYGNHLLQLAVGNGHFETFIVMLPYMKQEDLEEMFFLASESGHPRMVKYFLKHLNLNPNLLRPMGTVLMAAVSGLNVECVRVLLAHGADPSNVAYGSYPPGAQDPLPSNGHGTLRGPALNTALHMLATADSKLDTIESWLEIMQLLLSAGADIHARNSDGQTPVLLFTDCQSRSRRDLESKIPEVLVSKGADVSDLDLKGNNLLHLACTGASQKGLIMKFVDLGVNVKQIRIQDGFTPLHCLLKDTDFWRDRLPDQLEVLELLIQNGADINSADNRGDTPLHLVCRSGTRHNKQLVQFLLEHGSNANAFNADGQNCIQCYSLHYMHELQTEKETIQLLLDSGAEIEHTDHQGCTALHQAAWESATKLDILLQCMKKPDLSSRMTLDGPTLLHIACSVPENLDMFDVLIKYGADPRCRDNHGNSLWHVATQRLGGNFDRYLVDGLLRLGVDPHAVNSKGQTFLHVIPSTGFYMAKPNEPLHSYVLPLIKDLDVNRADMYGFTPLHYASSTSEAATFALLTAGANIDVKSSNLRTPLHCAAKGRQSGVISMLLRFAERRHLQLDLDAVDANGRTPLYDACVSGRPESVEILLNAGAGVYISEQPVISLSQVRSEFEKEQSSWSSIWDLGLLSNTEFKDFFTPILPWLDYWRTFIHRLPYHNHLQIDRIIDILISAGLKQEQPMEPMENYCAILLENFWKKYEQLDIQTQAYLKLREPSLASSPSRFTLGQQIAYFGLTEYMTHILPKIKNLEYPELYIHFEWNGRVHKTKPLPMLHAICERPTRNVEMLNLCLSHDALDVNARAWTLETHNYPDQTWIPGPTALHLLAQGTSFWQIEAIKRLVEYGKHTSNHDFFS